MGKLNQVPAACGLDCATCPVFAATQADSDEMRALVAARWGQIYGRAFAPADINCRGCRAQELFYLCKSCPIRDCADEKGLASCRSCDDFKCQRLERMYQFNREKATGVGELE